jgi:phage baseplate assembly protein W
MATYIGYSTIDSTIGSRVLVDKELAVRDLMNHFYTRKGERVRNPEFGCSIWDVLFDPLDTVTETLVRNDVERIVNSDPRWIFRSLRMEKPDDHTLNVRVQLVYDDTGTAEELYLNFVGEIE